MLKARTEKRSDGQTLLTDSDGNQLYTFSVTSEDAKKDKSHIGNHHAPHR